MLSKCANPACSAPFLYLHEGKLFRFDLGERMPIPPGHSGGAVQYFWLCEDCAGSMTLKVQGGEVMACPARTSGGDRRAGVSPGMGADYFAPRRTVL